MKKKGGKKNLFNTKDEKKKKKAIFRFEMACDLSQSYRLVQRHSQCFFSSLHGGAAI